MEPKTHPIEKEHHLKQTSTIDFHVDFPWCSSPIKLGNYWDIASYYDTDRQWRQVGSLTLTLDKKGWNTPGGMSHHKMICRKGNNYSNPYESSNTSLYARLNMTQKLKICTMRPHCVYIYICVCVYRCKSYQYPWGARKKTWRET